jgi:hypothetical protein
MLPGDVRYSPGSGPRSNVGLRLQSDNVSNYPGTKSMRMQVGQQAGHRGMHMPWRLHFGGYWVDVLETLDQWYGTDYRYIKVRGNDGGLYILRFDEPRAEWELTMFRSARAQVRMA